MEWSLLIYQRLIEGENVNNTQRRRRHGDHHSLSRTHSLTHSPPPGRVEHVLVALLDPEDEKAAHHDGQHHHT